MGLSVELCLVLTFVLLYVDTFIICRLVIRRLKNENFKEQEDKQKKLLVSLISGASLSMKKKLPIESYFRIKQSVELDKSHRETVEGFIDIAGTERKYLRKIKSLFQISRIEAAVKLGQLATDNARLGLQQAIGKEKSYVAKLYMANSLADIGREESLPVLLDSLIGSHFFYRDRVNMLIADFGEVFNSYLPKIVKDSRIEIKELIVDFSSVYFSEQVKEYLITLLETREEEIERLKMLFGGNSARNCANCMHCTALDNKEKRLCRFHGEVSASYSCRKFKVLPVSLNSVQGYERLVYKAAEVLAKVYPTVLNDEKYLNSKDVKLKNISVKALANFTDMETFKKLLGFLGDKDTVESAEQSISILLEKNPGYLNTVVQMFMGETHKSTKGALAEILSTRIEYFIMKLKTNNSEAAVEIIRQILLFERTNEIIDFLNKNKDQELEEHLSLIIKGVRGSSPEVDKEFSLYLKERIANKCGLQKSEEQSVRKEEQKDKRLIRSLYIMLACVLIFFPLLYGIRHFSVLFKLPPIQQIRQFIIDFNYYLAFYSIAINVLYILLLIISNFNAKRQKKLWNIKNMSLLFKRKMLPSISIIAPAYNEEKNIVESVNSLLNLKYPDYELIVVNDGSRDNTLDTLIKHFNLVRMDYTFENKLHTKPVRGVYGNVSIPKLILVDKENGGKADSLNTGINISNKEYFCGIDADSLLEEEALLKLASLTLDDGVETPALGGNIYPINGCKVQGGQITDIKLPENTLGKLQTMEYIRAFMAGRSGWAAVNSLLIISGAFGLFRKERVISVGGYLTSSGRYAKDTVGEDMELVVRISRLMRELKRKYKINYAFNANCWTEVPEDLKTLKKQRYRWHKGLIDILTFHKKMLFNPAYGRTGLIAMPYFFIFEMIGPIIEFMGYIMVVLAFVLGLFNGEIAILLFVSTVLMGVLVSVYSLLISEKDTRHFSLRDLLILTLFSFIENFGIRQFFSLWRVGGYLNTLRKPTGWGEMKRKGFAASSAEAKV